MRSSSIKLIALLFLIFLATLTSNPQASTVSVDASIAKPARFGGIQVCDTSDVRALGLNPQAMVAGWFAGDSGYVQISRSSQKYTFGIESGSWRVESGPFGAGQFGRSCDGIMDADTLSSSLIDSFAWNPPFWLLAVFRADTVDRYPGIWGYWDETTPLNVGYGLYLYENKLYFTVRDFDLLTTTLNTGEKTDLQNYHLVLCSVTSDSVKIYFDEDAPVTTKLQAHGTINPAQTLMIGRMKGAYLQGAIAALAWFEGEMPEEVQASLAQRWLPHLNGEKPFATIQPAIRFVESQPVDESGWLTVRIEHGYYRDQLSIQSDSLLLMGNPLSFPTIRPLPTISGPLAQIENSERVRVQNLVMGEYPGTGLEIDDAQTCSLSNVVFHHVQKAVELSQQDSGDTLAAANLTIADNNDGLVVASSCAGTVRITGSTFSGHINSALANEGAASVSVESCNFFGNTSDFSGTVSVNNPRYSPPLFTNSYAGDYRPLPFSPLFYGSTNGSWIGALSTGPLFHQSFSRRSWGRFR